MFGLAEWTIDRARYPPGRRYPALAHGLGSLFHAGQRGGLERLRGHLLPRRLSRTRHRCLRRPGNADDVVLAEGQPGMLEFPPSSRPPDGLPRAGSAAA